MVNERDMHGVLLLDADVTSLGELTFFPDIKGHKGRMDQSSRSWEGRVKSERREAEGRISDHQAPSLSPDGPNSLFV